MSVQLTSSRLQAFIDEQVRAGYFPSPEAAVEAAVEQMILDRDEIRLTPDDIDAIAESDAQIDRGEAIEFDAFAAEMRKKYCGT